MTPDSNFQSILLWLEQHHLKRIVLIGGILFVLFLFCNHVVMPIAVRHGQGVSVPAVTARPLAEAEKLLEEDGFKIVLEGEKYDPNFPPGYVVSQTPRAETVVKKGRRIYVMTSMGERLIVVPRLVGRSERDAKFIIESARLVLEHTAYEHSSYYPESVVSEQSLKNGQEVKAGTPISIVVSLGRFPDRFLVPEVKGKDLEAAINRIRKAGLTLGTVTYQTETQLLPNTVISQSIEPEQEVSSGTAIDLVVSQLPE
ncbi:PASTA domain-containing protein [candidate division KSB1 bacterium]|nr:PASTA domain-containing protein [candidate division KSB1 bacterium]